VIGKACVGGIVKKIILVFISALVFSVNGYAGELVAHDDSAKAVQQAAAANQQQNINPENILSDGKQNSPQSADSGEKTESPVSTHKTNYFSMNNLPGSVNAQVKFQISMRFQLLEPNLYILKHNIFPAYVAYTQKSLWNIGQESLPFEESNYNPEFFLDYPVNAVIWGRLKLRNIVVSPFEHESDGLVGVQSRSWNRQYVMAKFGLESKEKLEITNSFLPDKASLYLKLWNASGYSDQDTYLQSVGSNSKFMDYMGHGEIGISVRNFLWGGSFKNHQLDIKTPIFHDSDKPSYELEFRQQIPNLNFAFYMQYWYGYGETLLRFDQFGHRGFAGLSFSY